MDLLIWRKQILPILILTSFANSYQSTKKHFQTAIQFVRIACILLTHIYEYARRVWSN